MSGTSGPGTAPKARGASAASAMPGAADGGVGVAASPSNGRCPPSPGSRRRAITTSAAPTTGNPITRYHGGAVWPSSRGRSCQSTSSSSCTADRNTAATRAAGIPIAAPKTHPTQVRRAIVFVRLWRGGHRGRRIPRIAPTDRIRGRSGRLVTRLGAAIAARLSPERTRRATLLERVTVCRLPWEWVVRVHRWLELAGKLATVVWIVFVGSVVLGVNWKHVVEQAINSGRPVAGALTVAIVVPTLLFVAARSAIGFVRWRLQRELWRRDVARLEE
jgi:hypothetical protein